MVDLNKMFTADNMRDNADVHTERVKIAEMPAVFRVVIDAGLDEMETIICNHLQEMNNVQKRALKLFGDDLSPKQAAALHPINFLLSNSTVGVLQIAIKIAARVVARGIHEKMLDPAIVEEIASNMVHHVDRFTPTVAQNLVTLKQDEASDKN